jgi:hypothetical protein
VIIEKEKTHKQWSKQALNVSVFFVLLVTNLFRGSKKHPSMFGVERCSNEDWSSLGIYVIVCATICCFAVRNMQYEQKMKT